MGRLDSYNNAQRLLEQLQLDRDPLVVSAASSALKSLDPTTAATELDRLVNALNTGATTQIKLSVIEELRKILTRGI